MTNYRKGGKEVREAFLKYKEENQERYAQRTISAVDFVAGWNACLADARSRIKLAFVAFDEIELAEKEQCKIKDEHLSEA
jgi:hypothetical protein